MSRTRTSLMPLLLALTLGLAACSAKESPEPASANTPAAAVESETEPDDEKAEEPKTSGAIDADGFVIPGEIVQLELGDSVTYYSMPKLTLDDAQKVTIHSVEYIEKEDLPDAAPHDTFDTGVIVVSLTWESVLGSVQSNQGYLKVETETGDTGLGLFFREDKLKNGGVPNGESETGTFTYAIDRGPTTLTLGDYRDVPVAQLKVDTSN